MPEDKKVTKPCPKEEEKKKALEKQDDKKPEEDEEEKTKADIPQWGLDLKASVERIIDLMERKADPEDEKPVDEEEKQEDEEEKPKDEEKQEEKPVDEEKPEDEKKQDEEEKPEDEEKKRLNDMVKTAVSEAVKELGTIKIAKRGKAGDGTVKPLDIFAMHNIEWSEIHKASGFPDVPDYDLTTVPGWKGQSSLLIRTRKEN